MATQEKQKSTTSILRSDHSIETISKKRQILFANGLHKRFYCPNIGMRSLRVNIWSLFGRRRLQRFPDMSPGHSYCGECLVWQGGVVEIVVGWWNCVRWWFVRPQQRKLSMDLLRRDCPTFLLIRRTFAVSSLRSSRAAWVRHESEGIG